MTITFTPTAPVTPAPTAPAPTRQMKTVEQVLRASHRGPVLVKTGMNPPHRIVYREAWYHLYDLRWMAWGVRWQNKRTQRVEVLPLDLRPVLLEELQSRCNWNWEVVVEQQRTQPLESRRQWHPDRIINQALHAGFTREELGIPVTYTPDPDCCYDPEREAFQIALMWTVEDWSQPQRTA